MLRRKLIAACLGLTMVFAFVPFASFADDMETECWPGDQQQTEQPAPPSPWKCPGEWQCPCDNGGSGTVVEEPQQEQPEQPAVEQPEQPGGEIPQLGGPEQKVEEPAPQAEPEQTEPLVTASVKTKAKSGNSAKSAFAKPIAPAYELTVVEEQKAPLAAGYVEPKGFTMQIEIFLLILLAAACAAWVYRERRLKKSFEADVEFEDLDDFADWK